MSKLLYTRRGNIILAIIIFLIAAISLVMLKFIGMPKLGACTFKGITGFNCPGCGGTRFIINLLNFDLASAVYYNPFYALILLTLSGLYIFFISRTFKKNYTPPTYNFSVLTAIIICIIFIGFFIVRNLPFYQNIFY